MTLYAIIGDIHGNAEALTAALAFADRRGVDQLACVGDIVGYNADPNTCVNMLRERHALSVVGDDDLAAIGRADLRHYSERVAHALRCTRDALDETHRAYLADLPLTRAVHQDFVLLHGGLDDTQRCVWRARDVLEVCAQLDQRYPRMRLCFFGHTHRRIVHRVGPGTRVMSFEPDSELVLDPADSAVTLVNVGSLDASRKAPEDAWAQLALFDNETGVITFERLMYDRQLTERKAQRAGYRQGMVGKALRWALSRGRRVLEDVVLRRL